MCIKGTTRCNLNLMSTEGRFDIVFEELEEISVEGATAGGTITWLDMFTEAEEIANLRRIVLEATEPEAQVYVYMSC